MFSIVSIAALPPVDDYGYQLPFDIELSDGRVYRIILSVEEFYKKYSSFTVGLTTHETAVIFSQKLKEAMEHESQELPGVSGPPGVHQEAGAGDRADAQGSTSTPGMPEVRTCL